MFHLYVTKGAGKKLDFCTFYPPENSEIVYFYFFYSLLIFLIDL